MDKLPAMDGNVVHSPHVIILGAGASLASFPSGDDRGRRLPLMRNFIEVVGLGPILREAGFCPHSENFEALYDEISSSCKHAELASELEGRIFAYFEDMRLPPNATLYDYLILSLRKKDLIATFNWDPFLMQAYQRNKQVTEPPQIAFLHGNVAVGICYEHKVIRQLGFRCPDCAKVLRPSPLLFPVKHKDYSRDPFIKGEWDMFSAYLRESYFVTIFGYSAPTADVDARNLMLEMWRRNDTRELAQVEVVDICGQTKVKKNWNDFICRHHYGISPSIWKSFPFIVPRRSCEALAGCTLRMVPFRPNPFPKFRRLDRLHQWLDPLIREETAYGECRAQFSMAPCARR